MKASFEPALPGYGFADVADHIRSTIGPPFADMALAAAERSVPSSDPAPIAVMPVWPFILNLLVRYTVTPSRRIARLRFLGLNRGINRVLGRDDIRRKPTTRA